MAIKYKDNSKKVIKKLAKIHGGIAMAGADALNQGAEEIERVYKNRLKKNYKLKNKYTLNSTKTFKAHAKRKSGAIRPLGKINAVTGVRKMKGGKKHYMAKQEDGGVRRGNPKTQNRVPIPLNTARTSGNPKKPVAKRYRMGSGNVQHLQLNGRKFGVAGDGFKSGAQRKAILHKYQKQGRWDLSKPFLMQTRSGLGIYAAKGKKIQKIRTLDKSTVVIKARHDFEKSVKNLKPHTMDSFFLKAARRYVK